METSERRPPSIILVREWEQQLSSSGCCGRIEGDFLCMEGREGERLFSERRKEMESAGALYRALRERYGERVRLSIVDPRNLISLLPMIVREGWRTGLSLTGVLRTITGLSVNTVVVDGRIVARERWPSPDELFRMLDDVVEPIRT